MINSYDKKFSRDDQTKPEPKPREKKEKKEKPVKEIPQQNVPVKQNKEDKFLNNKKKRTQEDWEREKQEKMQKRKSLYKKLNQKTPKGQPVMKFQVQHLLHKIKDKISKGMI